MNGYYECLEHAHQFVRAVSSCQVVLFWFLVSGMAIIKKDSSAVILCCEGYALQFFYFYYECITVGRILLIASFYKLRYAICKLIKRAPIYKFDHVQSEYLVQIHV